MSARVPDLPSGNGYIAEAENTCPHGRLSREKTTLNPLSHGSKKSTRTKPYRNPREGAEERITHHIESGCSTMNAIDRIGSAPARRPGQRLEAGPQGAFPEDVKRKDPRKTPRRRCVQSRRRKTRRFSFRRLSSSRQPIPAVIRTPRTEQPGDPGMSADNRRLDS